MRILIDTNVLLDFVAKREPYYEEAVGIFNKCVDGAVQGCIVAHSITNMFYILRNRCKEADRRKILLILCDIFAVEGITREKIMISLRNEAFLDFEDCLQTECAKSYGADYIVTRNLNDFIGSAVRSISPSDFLKL